eukprot:1564103-Amphidinium_carterae.1
MFAPVCQCHCVVSRILRLPQLHVPCRSALVQLEHSPPFSDWLIATVPSLMCDLRLRCLH